MIFGVCVFIGGRIKNPNADSASRGKKWLGMLFLLLRWLVGGIVGFAGSFLLFFNQERLFFANVLIGQFILLEIILDYFLYKMPYKNIEDLSFFGYSAIWGLVGALLASGRKKQIKVGVILLILYLIAGCFFFLFLIFSWTD